MALAGSEVAMTVCGEFLNSVSTKLSALEFDGALAMGLSIDWDAVAPSRAQGSPLPRLPARRHFLCQEPSQHLLTLLVC